MILFKKYICAAYPHVKGRTTYIAYGADVKSAACPNEKIDEWMQGHGIERGQYYLIVGRFVPENNYEAMITGFMKSSTDKSLVIITNMERNKFYKELNSKTNFGQDSRIKFVGTVYDAELLKKIRECAYAYIHGHEVGGTNPSLLEALASTKLNLLLDVGFNREVAGDGALYWAKDTLAELIDAVDQVDMDYCEKMYQISKKRVLDLYSWEKICREYEGIFC